MVAQHTGHHPTPKVKLSVVALHFSLLTDPIPSVPLVPEIAHSLLKDKSRLGAQVRTVSVWCVFCAQCLCQIACITTSHSLRTASHAVGVARPCSTLLSVLVSFCWPHTMLCPETVGFFDHVNDKTSVCTCLHDSLWSSKRLKRCSIQCRSRSPLTQRVCSRFDVCGIRLEVLQSGVELGATRILAVGHCKTKSSWYVFESSQRDSAFGTWCPW